MSKDYTPNAETKSLAVEVKAVSDGKPGEFEALAAAYNTDSIGDRIIPGAFKRSLQERGLPAILWSHEWNDVPIGVCTEAYETDAGLYVKGRLFVADDEYSQRAREVHTALKAGVLKKFSIGYSVVRASAPISEGNTIREIYDVELFEVSVVLVPANESAQLLSVKAATQEVAEAVEHVAEAVEAAAMDEIEPTLLETVEALKAEVEALKAARETEQEVARAQEPEEEPAPEASKPLDLDVLFPKRHH